MMERTFFQEQDDMQQYHHGQSLGLLEADGASSMTSSSATSLTQTPSEPPSSTRTATTNATKCSWALTVAMLLFGQFFPRNASSPSDGNTNGMIYSAVSASLLRRQEDQRGSGVLPVNVQLMLTWAIVLWQLSSKAGPIVRVLISHATLFSAWYMEVLNASPLITKSITTAVIGLLGDTGAQYVEERIRAKTEGGSMMSNSNNGPWRRWFRNYDRRRGLSIVGGSILVTGPLLHLAYNVLERWIPVAGVGGAAASVAALTQVFINDFFLDAIFVATTIVTTGVAEGYARQIVPQFRNDYLATVRASWATSLALMPLEFACFRFLPLSFRVLGMNFIDIFWEALISYMVHRRRRLVKTMANDAASSSSPTSDPSSTSYQPSAAAACPGADATGARERTGQLVGCATNAPAMSI
jgi:Mpv17 / PMP22 family